MSLGVVLCGVGFFLVCFFSWVGACVWCWVFWCVFSVCVCVRMSACVRMSVYLQGGLGGGWWCFFVVGSFCRFFTCLSLVALVHRNLTQHPTHTRQSPV